MSEPLTRMLAELPLAEPDAARANRTRTRCRARLAKRTLSASRAAASRHRASQVWQPLVTLLGAAYLTAVILQALRVYGFP